MVSRIFFLLVFFGLQSAVLKAQTGFWDNSKGKGFSELKEKKISAYKRWKSQLEQYGMDSSYRYAFYIGGSLNTNGWAGCLGYEKPLQRGRKAISQSIYYELSFSEVKHEKQQKQQSGSNAYPELGKSSPFIFGKINNLYLLQLGMGKEKLLLPKVIENNTSVSVRYGGGFSLAMLKPYYLKLIHIDYTPQETVSLHEEHYTDANADLFLNKDRILGASPWSKGLDEISYIPGLYVDGAIVIEPAKSKFFIQHIILGAQFSVYAQSLPIMADRTAFPWVGELFVGVMVGKE